MKIPRVYFHLIASAAFVSLLAASCVVSDGDDDDTSCTPGESKDCSCSDGRSGQQICTPGGTRFGECVCTGNTGGAGGGGGNAGSGNNGGTSGGSDAGSSGAGASGDGGLGGAGGAAGLGGGAGEAGAGGAAGLCEDPLDACETCLFDSCCAEYSACFANATCADEFSRPAVGSTKQGILLCIDEQRALGAIGPSIVLGCVNDVSGGQGTAGLNPRTKALLDCMGGGSDWSAPQPTWPATGSCSIGCFDQL